MALFAHPLVTRAADAADGGAQAAIVRGLDWLRTNQQTNGAWSNVRFPALTALPLWAMAREGRPADATSVDAAVRFLLTQVRADGGIYADVPGQKGGGLSNYNTAICMIALHATGRRDLVRVVQNARTFVAGAQYLGDDEYRGGFGYDRSTGRAYTDLMNTHFSAEAMRRTQSVEDLRPAGEQRADIDWNAAVAFATKLQNTATNSDPENAGGFTYNPNDPKAGTVTNAEGQVFLRSYGSITYAGLLSLVHAQIGPTDPRVVSAVDFAGRHWTLDENPGMGQQGLYFYYNVMARALATAGRDTIPRPANEVPLAWRPALVQKLVSLQQPDGSWVNPNNRFWEGDPVLATAYAVLALENARPAGAHP